MSEDQAQRAIDKHIADVKSALEDAGSSTAQTNAIEQEIRDHIDEAMLEEGASYDEVLNSLDPPESYQMSGSEPVIAYPDTRGKIGFFVGLFFTIWAFIILPNVGLPQLAPASLIIGLFVSATLGIAGRKGRFGVASLFLALAILAFIIVMNISGG